MGRLLWLVLVGGVCFGCAKKEEAPLPSVALEPGEPRGPAEPRVAVPLVEAKPKVFGLSYGTLWDPKSGEKFDPAAATQLVVAERYFAKHQTAFFAPATVGSMVCLTQGGLHGVVVPPVLSAAYPDAATKFEAEWEAKIKAAAMPAQNSPMINASTSATGAPSTRMMVFRVKNGTDDELRIQFGQYLMRVEEAVKGTGVTLTVHQRGGIRITGSQSDIRYESETRTGHVRSVVVRQHDETDHELIDMLGGGQKGIATDMYKRMLKAEMGPFLVVSMREQRR